MDSDTTPAGSVPVIVTSKRDPETPQAPTHDRGDAFTALTTKDLLESIQTKLIESQKDTHTEKHHTA